MCRGNCGSDPTVKPLKNVTYLRQVPLTIRIDLWLLQFYAPYPGQPTLYDQYP